MTHFDRLRFMRNLTTAFEKGEFIEAIKLTRDFLQYSNGTTFGLKDAKDIVEKLRDACRKVHTTPKLALDYTLGDILEHIKQRTNARYIVTATDHYDSESIAVMYTNKEDAESRAISLAQNQYQDVRISVLIQTVEEQKTFKLMDEV